VCAIIWKITDTISALQFLLFQSGSSPLYHNKGLENMVHQGHGPSVTKLRIPNISFTFSKLQHYLWVIHNPDLLMWLRISTVTENEGMTRPCASLWDNLDAGQPSAQNQLFTRLW